MKRQKQNWILKGLGMLCVLAFLCFVLSRGGFPLKAPDAQKSEAAVKARAATSGGIEEKPADPALTVLKVTGVSAKNREYDGTTAVSLEGGALKTEAGENLPEGAGVELDGSKAEGEVSDKNASASDKQVTVNGYALKGADADKYILKQPEGITVRISQVKLTPSVAYVADKVYDGTKSAVGDLELQGNMASGEHVTANGTFAFVTADAGKNKAVNVTNIRLDSEWVANYTLTATSLTNVPTDAEITVSGVTGDIASIIAALPDPSLTAAELRPYKEEIKEALISYRALPDNAKLQVEEDLVEKLAKLIQKFVKVEASVDHEGAGVSVSASNIKNNLPYYITAKELEEEKKIKLVLQVRNKTSSKPDSGKINDLLKDEKDSRKVGAYFSIDLKKKTGGQTVDFSETLGQIKISIEIPSNMKDGKRYKVIRAHKGTVTKLDTDTENGKVKFKTDRFSTFAIAYEASPKKTGQQPVTPSAGTDYEAIYWSGVSYAIQNAADGATVSMGAGAYNQVPASVIHDLKGRNVTLSLTRNDGSVVSLNGNQIQALVQGVNSYKIEDLPSIFAGNKGNTSQTKSSSTVKKQEEKQAEEQNKEIASENEKEKLKNEIKEELKQELEKELAKADQNLGEEAASKNPAEKETENLAQEAVSAAVVSSAGNIQFFIIIACLVIVIAVILTLLILEKKKNGSI